MGEINFPEANPPGPWWLGCLTLVIIGGVVVGVLAYAYTHPDAAIIVGVGAIVVVALSWLKYINSL